MTDIVSQLVGALEAATTELESHQGNPYCNLYDLPEFKAAIAQARAALTAAKAGGWVAVPVEPTLEMLDAMSSSAYLPNCYRAMLSARPTTPPKEQA